jgi:hypothetical protein
LLGIERYLHNLEFSTGLALSWRFARAQLPAVSRTN